MRGETVLGVHAANGRAAFKQNPQLAAITASRSLGGCTGQCPPAEGRGPGLASRPHYCYRRVYCKGETNEWRWEELTARWEWGGVCSQGPVGRSAPYICVLTSPKLSLLLFSFLFC